MNFLLNFLRFSRPHTIIGTTLSILSLYAIALSFSDFSTMHWSVLVLTLISCLGANIYIVGLNQLTDIEIDKINKPYLPLASGAFSVPLASWIVGISVAVSLAIAIYLGKYLLATVLISLFLGTAYSIPPTRLKRFHFWAAFCIIAIRGLVVNLLLFLHFHHTINGLQNIPFIIWLLTITIFIYSLVIAWFKDIPDIDGDRQYNIRTLSIRLGAQNVFQMGSALIILVDVFLITLPFFTNIKLDATLFIVAHITLLLLLLIANNKVNLSYQPSVQRYYQFIWVLLFLEYLTFAAAGLAG